MEQAYVESMGVDLSFEAGDLAMRPSGRSKRRRRINYIAASCCIDIPLRS
jgi:hypothetical protein